MTTGHAVQARSRHGAHARAVDNSETYMQVKVEQHLAADRERVWALLTDWERQPQWMMDAVAVEVLTPQRQGDGVTIRCPTRLLGFVVDDVMRVTRWDPNRRLDVVHLGRVIRGSGSFELHDAPGGTTRITWNEWIDPPLGVIGALGAHIAVRPLVTAIFRRSLRRFANLIDSDAAQSLASVDGGDSSKRDAST